MSHLCIHPEFFKRIASGITPYQMTRQSFASQLGELGVPVNIIKNLLVHSEISTSMKYTHQEIESMRTSIEKLSLKGKGQVVQFPQNQEVRVKK